MNLFATFILYLLILFPIASTSGTATNLDRIEQLFNNILTPIFQGLADEDSVDILIGAQNSDILYKWVVEQQIIKVVRDKGFANIFLEPHRIIDSTG